MRIVEIRERTLPISPTPIRRFIVRINDDLDVDWKSTPEWE